MPDRRSQFRKYRKIYNVSQRKVSIDLNVSENHIRNIESGRGNPDAKLLFKLCNYFGAKPEELFPDLACVSVPSPKRA
jgi:putative transcriptional regulator